MLFKKNIAYHKISYKSTECSLQNFILFSWRLFRYFFRGHL